MLTKISLKLNSNLDKSCFAIDDQIKEAYSSLIVFEKDGKLVKIDPENNLNGIGSGDIIVNDEPCK